MTNSQDILPSFLKVLIYFDVFRYPLTVEEIKKMIPTYEEENLESSLLSLVTEKILFQSGDLFGLNEGDKYFLRRKEGNSRANNFKQKALKRGRFISKFPFVRGVFISGSFSKGHLLKRNLDDDYYRLPHHHVLKLLYELTL